MNTNWYYSLGVAIPVVTTLLLWGILKVIFQIEVNINLFNTGITPGMILGAANVFLAIAIFKKRI